MIKDGDRVCDYMDHRCKGVVFEREDQNYVYVVWDTPSFPGDPQGIASRTHVRHLRLIPPLEQLAECAE